MYGIKLDAVFIGRCAYAKATGCKHTVRVIHKDMTSVNDYRCLQHPNYPLNWYVLNGTFNPGKKCDSRCMGARGHNCECQCGGANHGIDYA